MKHRDSIYIFLAAVGFRILMYLAAALIMIFQGTDGTLNIDSYLANWCKWDANHYLNIAKNGYEGVVEFCAVCQDALISKGVSPNLVDKGQHLFLVFFPLFPLVMRLFGILFSDLRIAGLLVSTFAYAGGCVYMYKVVKLDHSAKTAWNSVILLSLFPFGFFFGGIMSEGLFLLVSTGCLYHLRKHEWWRAVLFGALASMCRMQGALLMIPAGMELLLAYQPWSLLQEKMYHKLREMFLRAMSLFLMLAGIGVYLLINWKVEGDPFRFMLYQKMHWNQGLCLPTQTLAYVFRNGFSENYDLQMRFALWIPQAVLAVVSVVVFLYGFKKLRPAYLGYGISYVILTYSATWLLSGGRYLSCCIPLFIVLAVATEKKKWIMPTLTLVFGVLHIIYFAGYLRGLHIM